MKFLAIDCGKIIKFNLKFDPFHSTDDVTLDSQATHKLFSFAKKSNMYILYLMPMLKCPVGP